MAGLRCLDWRWMSWRRALLGVGVAVGCVVFGGGGAAPAGAAVLNLGLCDGSALSRPFLPWGDWSEYKLAPDGQFAAGDWALGGGAQIVAGSDPIGSGGSVPVLELAPGASALSGVSCVDAAYPTVRMFVAGTGALSVSLVMDGHVVPAGVAVAGGGWQPTLPMMTLAAVDGALSGGTAEVSLLLTGLRGRPVVDDVYIDPWYRG